MNKIEFEKLLISIIEEKNTLSNDDFHLISDIIFTYIQLMNEAKIEKADKLLEENMPLLEKIK